MCWDSFDGFFIVDNNWVVGIIIGIWDLIFGIGVDGLFGVIGCD